MSLTIDQLEKRLDTLQSEVAALKSQLMAVTPAASLLSIREKQRIVAEAHASGSRAQIIRAHRLINGEPTP